VPALANGEAGRCASLTMLQRSPTWYRSGRVIDEFVKMLRELDLPDDWVHEIARRKVLLEQGRFAERAKAQPEAVKQELLSVVKACLGPARQAEVERHFTPRYRPWQQRLAFLPDGDLFKAVAEGRAEIVTDEIERFASRGIQLKSGAHLAADVVVTATGFEVSALGEIPFAIDGKPLNLADTVTWRGAMFTGVPNLLWVFGYIRASWTLRVDLLGDFTCRLLAHMQARDATVVVPRLRPQDEAMPRRPWIDPEDFNPGYLQRGMDRLPQQGDHWPWLHGNDYWVDKDELPAADLEDGTLQYR
jgi:cation diffusion facilitator CzcD-associated flavoprotein CzcO